MESRIGHISRRARAVHVLHTAPRLQPASYDDWQHERGIPANLLRMSPDPCHVIEPYLQPGNTRVIIADGIHCENRTAVCVTDSQARTSMAPTASSLYLYPGNEPLAVAFFQPA